MSNYTEHYNQIKLYSMFIYSMYRKLAKLEFEHKLDSPEYENTLNVIARIKKAENDYYEMLAKTYGEKQILAFNVIAQKEMLGQTSPNKPIHDPAYLFSNKLKRSDVVIMRISSKIADIFRHMYYKNPATINVYDTYGPIRDKYFLDVLSSQIGDSDYSGYRKMLIDAKYDYAFVNDKNVCELLDFDEKDEENENIDLIVSLGTVLEYKDRFAKLNNATLMSEKNRRRFLLDVDYIRASALGAPKEHLEILKYSLESQKEPLSEGSLVFCRILDMALEDKDIFDEGDIPYTRRF